MSSLFGKYILNKPLVCTRILQVSSARTAVSFALLTITQLQGTFHAMQKYLSDHIRVPFPPPVHSVLSECRATVTSRFRKMASDCHPLA